MVGFLLVCAGLAIFHPAKTSGRMVVFAVFVAGWSAKDTVTIKNGTKKRKILMKWRKRPL